MDKELFQNRDNKEKSLMVTFQIGQMYYQVYRRDLFSELFCFDLTRVVGTVCKLFADDCKLYHNRALEADQKESQDDIDIMCK